MKLTKSFFSLALLAAPGVAYAPSPGDAPQLPITGTRIVNVATEAQLQTAMGDLQNGDTLLLSNGSYNLTRSLYVNGRHNATIRGASGSTNVVLAGKGLDNSNYGDVPFGVWSNGTNTTIAHLTIRDTWDNEMNGNEFYAVEFRFATTTNGTARNNLADAPIHLRDSATAALNGNQLTAVPALFVNPAAADLHLLATATNAIDKSPALLTVTNDFDGERRPRGASADTGADEFSANVPPVITSLALNEGSSVLRFTTLLGLSYDLERAAEVTGGDWSVVATNLAGTGGDLAFTDTNTPGQARGFYRVRLSP